MLTYTLALKTVSEANRREHWAAKHRRTKALRTMSRMVTESLIRECSLRLVQPRVIAFNRRYIKPLDDDNLASALKAVRDGICDALGIDDAESSGVQFRYSQSRTPNRADAGYVDVSIHYGNI